MGDTKIAWTDKVWNPITGCTKVSAGCKNCYAERIAGRKLPGHHFEDRSFSDVRFHPERLDAPLHWRKPRRIFVNSMSDLFHEKMTDEDIAEVFGVMAVAQRHTFQILTKRPRRMAALLTKNSFWDHVNAVATIRAEEITDLHDRRTDDALATTPEGSPEDPLPNVWLGVSVESQAAGNERIPLLMATPAAVWFVSLEPLLGLVEFRPSWLLDYDYTGRGGSIERKPRLDWVIVGGESGPKARPCDVAWIRSVLDQCKAAGVPCFVKQLGRWIAGDPAGFTTIHRCLMPGGSVFVTPILGENASRAHPDAMAWGLCDKAGADSSEWPEDLRVQEFPR